MVAHNLARLSHDSGNFVLWDGDPPPSVLRDVINDVSVFEVKIKSALCLKKKLSKRKKVVAT
jgi:hypothetical protein